MVSRAHKPEEDSTAREPGRERKAAYPHTPDDRYFVVRGRLWRLANPRLDAGRRKDLVKALMAARRAVRSAP